MDHPVIADKPENLSKMLHQPTKPRLALLTDVTLQANQQTKEQTTNRFTGEDNEQDILNTQLSVLNLLIQRLRMGQLHQDMYQLDGAPNLTPFHDRFEAELCGWSATMNIQIYNDLYIC